MLRNFMGFLVLGGMLVNPVAAEVTVSSGDSQKKMQVTVYNQNFALIKDTRQLTLPSGEGELRFMDVAAAIMPVTVHVKSLTAGEHFKVLEQNYEYDLMDRSKLLDKFVGQKIKLLDQNPYQDRTDVVDAVLLSHNNNQPIYQINGEIFLGHPGIHVLPRVPDNLIAKPTLMWLYANTQSGTQDLELSYLTEKMNWKADYVLLVDAEDASGDLSGWVTIDNQSGAEYRDATLKLVAGEVNRVVDRSKDSRMMRETAMTFSDAGSGMFTEESFFEYHIYDLQRPTTIKDRQTKQINLLNAAGVKLTKTMDVFGQSHYYFQEYRQNSPKQPVVVKLTFQNSLKNNLGMPLPQGVVRLYKKDSKGQLQFIGEDRITHTPREEEVTLKIGEAFDVVAERRQTDFRRVTTRLTESAWEIKLRNRKDTPVKVSLIEPMPPNWTMMEHSHGYTKKDAFTARFEIDVPADKEVVVTYRVQVGQ